MNVLDWVLVAVAAGYALAGFRQGFLVGALATVGLLGGGAVGVAVAPLTLDRFDPSLGVSLLALLLVLVAAVVGQAVGSFAGAALRSAVSWQPARALDALGGAALSAAAVLVVAWALGVAVSAIRLPGVGTQVRSSAVLSLVDRTLPAETDRLLQSLADVVDTSVFPRYLEPFFPERIRPVRPPSAAVLRDQDVVQARHSVVRVLGSSEACGTLQGSGFVYAPERVMTNAHVVAGIVEPEVEVAGRRFPAVPVVYDPDVDLAVLAVEGLPAPALRFGSSSRQGAAAAVLGFPQGGPLTGEPARVRDGQTLRGPDIYGEGVVTREVLSLRANVQPGNSGGPVVSRRGRALGVVFAASLSDAQTGYAVTAGQARRDAAAGRRASEAVPTGSCA